MTLTERLFPRAGSGGSVLSARAGDVGVILLNRPGVLNAVNGEMTRALDTAIAEAEADAAIRVIVVTGSGRAFCAGLDLKSAAGGSSAIAEAMHPEHGFAAMTARRVAKPLIAAVNGDAVGGGFEIALSCDAMVVADNARLALPEVRRGLLAAGNGIVRLVQQAPKCVAMELLLTGRLFGAVEAERWGLANHVVPQEEVLERTLRLAREIANNAPLALIATKRIAELVAREGAPTAEAEAAAELERLLASGDAAEGRKAFVEKRKPEWAGS